MLNITPATLALSVHKIRFFQYPAQLDGPHAYGNANGQQSISIAADPLQHALRNPGPNIHIKWAYKVTLPLFLPPLRGQIPSQLGSLWYVMTSI